MRCGGRLELLLTRRRRRAPPPQADLSYLRDRAGGARVKIEPIHPNGHFGTAAEREEVPLELFLDMLEDEEMAGQFYLTTQYDQPTAAEKIATTRTKTIVNKMASRMEQRRVERVRPSLPQATIAKHSRRAPLHGRAPPRLPSPTARR